MTRHNAMVMMKLNVISESLYSLQKTSKGEH